MNSLDINREKASKAFADYVVNYNAEDEKVKLKIDHTYRVAALCEKIAESIELTREEIDFAWFTGLLHDVGRFEQLKNYGTFNDAQSIDHALYGAKILFDDGRISDYIVTPLDSEQKEFLRKVLSCHSAYRIPEDYNKREKMFADILRDADKIDILKVNVDVPLEEIYNVTSEELRTSEVTEAVMENFSEKRATPRMLKRTPVDNVVGHISLVYELVYPISLKIVEEQGYLDKLLKFKSDNPKTMEQFHKLRIMMEAYLEQKKLK